MLLSLLGDRRGSRVFGSFVKLTLGLSSRSNFARGLRWLQFGQLLRDHGRATASHAALERAFALDPRSHAIALDLVKARPRGSDPDRIGFIALGTMGRCNASCIHCPTGKTATDHVPRTPMPMPLFRKIIDEIAALRLPISGQFAFGLFGDALLDPHVVERAAYLREHFPSTPLSINTNGAAFNLQRHAALLGLNVIIGLHCESIVPESFDVLMHPLRLERLIPKYEQILERFGDRVYVSIPLSRLNLHHAAQTRSWFKARGAHVILAPIASRCAEDRSVFDQLALKPYQMRCGSAVLDDIVIDCDGTLLRCCQDFRRDEPIGNVADQPLREIMFGSSRRAHAHFLDQGRHAESVTCSRCFADGLDEIEGFLTDHEVGNDAFPG